MSARSPTMVKLPPAAGAVAPLVSSGGSAAASPGTAVRVAPATSSSSSSSSLVMVDPRVLLDTYSRRTTSTTQTHRPALDPVQFLNQHYPTESSLTHQLNDLRDAVSLRMNDLDDRISLALQRQSETAAATRQNVQSAQQAIETLNQRIHLVQQKAAQSEHAVLSITADMKLLDTSKRHLQRTITTLKRLHMLVHAVEELRLLSSSNSKQPDFKTASQLVQAITILSKHFDIYTNKVPPLQKLSATVSVLETDLKHQVIQGFRRTALGVEQVRRLEQEEQQAARAMLGGAAAGTAPSSSVIGQEEDTSSFMVMTPDVMRGGVLYLDALGLPVRQEFITNFCHDLLRPYVQEYTPPEPKKTTTSSSTENKPRISSFKVVPEPVATEPEPKLTCYLDSVEQRFLWFRKVLEDDVQPKFGTIFPFEWNAQVSLARAFLVTTKQHFLTLLAKGPKKDSTNAAVLLKALQKTLVFEKEITAWLIRECQTQFIDYNNNNNNNNAGNNNNNNNNNNTTKQVPPKASGKGARRESSSDYESLDGREDDDDENNNDGPNKAAAVPPLLGVASVAFEHYMGPYIDLEKQSMREQLAQALEDRTVDNRGALPVFISSTNLFVYIKGSIVRCTALTKGKPFFLLYQAFGEALKQYATILNGKLPKPISSSSSGLPPIPNMAGLSIAGLGGGGGGTKAGTSADEDNFKIPPGEEVTVCHVISTCEYCTDTVEALEELIRDTMQSSPQYQSKIQMMEEQEAFHELTAKAIRVLVTGLTHRTHELAIKPHLMTINWGQWQTVGEESDYVHIIHREVEPFFITAKSLLPVSYFRSFCDKFAAAFCNLFYETVVRLRRINEQGTQQLLLDVYNLKTLFLKLPVLEDAPKLGAAMKPGSTIAPAMYTKLVQKLFGKIETLLKLVGTPDTLLIANFKSMVSGGTAAELQSIMNLKGIKRPEQVVFLEKFGLDPARALQGATMGVSSTSIVTERVQAVTSDLNQMRQKVDDFRKSFR